MIAIHLREQRHQDSVLTAVVVENLNVLAGAGAGFVGQSNCSPSFQPALEVQYFLFGLEYSSFESGVGDISLGAGEILPAHLVNYWVGFIIGSSMYNHSTKLSLLHLSIPYLNIGEYHVALSSVILFMGCPTPPTKHKPTMHHKMLKSPPQGGPNGMLGTRKRSPSGSPDGGQPQQQHAQMVMVKVPMERTNQKKMVKSTLRRTTSTEGDAANTDAIPTPEDQDDG